MASILGRGLRFPLRPRSRYDGSVGGPLGLDWSEGEAQVAQSIWLILATAPGERPMRPEFGCGIHELVFQPNTSALHDRVRGRVQEALLRYEPRIEVREVNVADDPDAAERLLIEVGYAMRGHNQLYNLVYPFYLQEGAG